MSEHYRTEGGAAEQKAGLGQGEILRDGMEIGACLAFILADGFEHKDTAMDVNGDEVRFPVTGADLAAMNLESPSLVDVAEQAKAEVHGMFDDTMDIDHALVAQIDGHGTGKGMDDAGFISGRDKRRVGLEGEADDVAVGGGLIMKEESLGHHAHDGGKARLILLMIAADAGDGGRIMDIVFDPPGLLLSLGGIEERAVALQDAEDGAAGGFDLFTDDGLPGESAVAEIFPVTEAFAVMKLVPDDIADKLLSRLAMRRRSLCEERESNGERQEYSGELSECGHASVSARWFDPLAV